MATSRTRPTSRLALQVQEDIIATAETWDRERAKALLKIQREKLWEGQYESFDSYGVIRWGYDNSYVYRLCEWAKILELLPIGRTPERESIARPLYGLPAETVQKVWKAVERSATKPTAAIVFEAVAAHLKKQTPQKPTGAASRGSGSVIRADAVKGLATLSDGTIDLLLTSPPYARQREKDYPSIDERLYPEWTVRWMEAARPKLATRGSIMLVIREHVRDGVISDYLLKTRLAIREAGWYEIDVLIWHKPDAPPTGRPDRPRRAFEYVLWYSATPKPFADPKACGMPNKESRERMARPRFLKTKNGHHGHQPFARFRVDQNARVTDLIVAPTGTSSSGVDHPATYPVALCDQLIKTYSPVGGLVADCCCGSGTTLIAAREAGRNWWGCDVVPKYVALAKRRLNQSS